MTNEKLEQLADDIKAIRADNVEIKMALLGSEKLKIKGIVQKVSDIEDLKIEDLVKNINKKIDDHENYIQKDKKLKYTINGIMLSSGFFIGFLSKFWDKIFKR